MAHVTTTRQAFTGHVGRVRFTNGHADTELADELEHFRNHPELYAVTGEAEDEHDQDDDPEDG